MQKILSVILLLPFCFSAVTSSAQNISDLETFEKAMKLGAILTYDITMGEKRYQLIATIKKLGEEIAYDWKTTAPENKSGSINMNANSVSKADALFHNLSGGESRLDKEVSLFISNNMFNDVSTIAETNVKLGGVNDTATLLSNTISEFNFNLNGNLLAVPGWELQGGSEVKYTLSVLESVKFPLIVRLDMGWMMQLAEIKTQ